MRYSDRPPVARWTARVFFALGVLVFAAAVLLLAAGAALWIGAHW